MKPMFTVHEGEFLVGDHIQRNFGKKYDVWVPTRDSGIDLLVTRSGRKGRAVGLQVKFSRSFDVRDNLPDEVIATSWYTLDVGKVRASQADLWVFVILTMKRKAFHVVVPTAELRKRIPPRQTGKWRLYLWVCKSGRCFQVRDLGRLDRLTTLGGGGVDKSRDFGNWLENWGLLGTLTANPVH